MRRLASFASLGGLETVFESLHEGHRRACHLPFSEGHVVDRLAWLFL